MRRYACIVFLFFLGGMAYVPANRIVKAQAITPGGMARGDYGWPGNGYFNIDFNFTIEVYPGGNQSIFWAHQFWFENAVDGGYLGLQGNGIIGNQTVGKMAIFSIWNVSNAVPGPGAAAQAFGGEGVGYSVRLPYQWQQGRTYRFRIQAEGNSWWGVRITDTATGTESYIGSIQALPGWGNLRGSSTNFTEIYGPVSGCQSTPYTRVRFGLPLANNGTVSATILGHGSYGDCAAYAQTFTTGTTLTHEIGVATFSGAMPAAWSVVDGGSGGGTASTWTTANPGARSPGTPFTGAAFAIVDSDKAGELAIQNEQLITPVINASACSGEVFLEFSNQFHWYDLGLNEIADVDVSTNGGSIWTNVLRMQGANDGFPTPNTKLINITSVVGANRSNVQIRFHYYNSNFEWWWAIDNVKVRCASSALRPATIGFYESVGGAFFFKFSNTSGPADYAFTFGPANQGWTPVIGDWNGDGVATIGLYYPANGAFYIRNSNTSGIADIYITYGPAGQGWLPVIGDWDGNGTQTVGLYNPGNGFFYLRNSNTIGYADLYLCVWAGRRRVDTDCGRLERRWN